MTSRTSSLSLLSACCIVATFLTACGGGSGAAATDTSVSSSSSTQASGTQASGTQTSSTGATSTQASSSNTLSSSSATSSTSTGTGTTLAFSYASGFSGATGLTTAASAQFSGSLIALSSSAYGQHQAGAVWYASPQNIQSFTTDFTFQVDPSAFGITFCIQNSNATTNPSAYGSHASADTNMLGYGAYSTQPNTAIANSIAIKFDLTADNGNAYYGANPSSTGLYLNGGPIAETGLVPETNLTALGINLHSGDTMSAHVVYDGSILTMVLTDTVTGASARMSWPVDIPNVVGGNTAYVGFTGGTIPAVSQNILSWSFWTGYNPKLATPTFSVAGGSYASTQTLSISAPSGATIHYTTNGQPPTAASATYSGPLAVNSSQIVQAVAVESGYSDSTVATASYQISSASAPAINFPNGFSNATGLVSLNGTAQFSGTSLQLTDTANNLEASSAWFLAPVNVQSFTTSFTLQLTSASANGLTFTIQNQNPASTDSGSLVVSGGPFTLASGQSNLGYTGILNSVAVKFDLYSGSGDTTGLYTNGAAPSSSSLDMTASGVSLHSGHPLNVTLTYNGTTLAMKVTDTTTSTSYSTSWTINIPSIVGGNTAYVGFTAGTGGQTATQQVTTWTYSN